MYGEGHPTGPVSLKMGCCSAPLCHSMSPTSHCHLHAIWYLLLFLNIENLCLFESLDTCKASGYTFFSELDYLNRIVILSGLPLHTPNNSGHFQMVWFSVLLLFSYSSLILKYLQVLCAYFWLFHISDLDISIQNPLMWWFFTLDFMQLLPFVCVCFFSFLFCFPLHLCIRHLIVLHCR